MENYWVMGLKLLIVIGIINGSCSIRSYIQTLIFLFFLIEFFRWILFVGIFHWIIVMLLEDFYVWRLYFDINISIAVIDLLILVLYYCLLLVQFLNSLLIVTSLVLKGLMIRIMYVIVCYFEFLSWRGLSTCSV
jgi:hypothetical protein